MFLIESGLWSAVGSGSFVSVAYSDSSSGEIPNLVYSEGPGILRGHNGLGL